MHYTYEDGTAALCGVNITIPKNKKVAFIGMSGAGKTTLVDLLMGLYSPCLGTVHVDGKALTLESDVLASQKLFAYIPQSIILYDKTIKENIAFSVNENDINIERVWQCLQLAHLDDFVERLDGRENTCKRSDLI